MAELLTDEELRKLRATVEYSTLTELHSMLAAAAWAAIKVHCFARYESLREIHVDRYDTEMHLRSLTYELRESGGRRASDPGPLQYMNWVLENACRECITNDSETGEHSHGG